MQVDGRNFSESELKKGYFIKPTIMECNPDNFLFKEETFGPVFALTKFDTIEEGLQIANNTEYGLSGLVITKDLEKGEEVAKKIQSGSVFVNAIQRNSPFFPCGGIKNSGYGRECSKWGFEEFANIKVIEVNQL